MSRAKSMPEVTTRERVVLATVVRGYVASAHAVGSRWVARASGLDLSPASIRNCMMDLEERGFLTHLHTSGGRLPTNSGYRYFVDSLMKPPALGKKLLRAIDEALAPDRFASVETLLDQACVILGRSSDQLSVVVSPRYDRTVVDRIEMSQVDERRLLVVFRLSSGLERTVIVALDHEIGSEELRRTLQVMNTVARDITLAALTKLRDDEEMRVHLRELKPAIAVFRGARELLNDDSADHVHLWGTSNMLAQPEFENRDRLRDVFRTLEDRDVLCGLFEPTRHRKQVCVTIGEENPIPELRDCSIVSVSYRIGEFGGSVGVIGPTRMPYEMLVALVDYVARTVGRVLDRNRAN
jgi:heat-inducible transcriptional repressor